MRTVTRFVSARLTNRARALVLVLVCVGGASSRAAAQTTTVDLDGLLLSVSQSRTAQLFHIVDQLSEWDEFAHKGYGRWATRTALLDQTARDLLKQHADLRRARGWEKGFEQSFYSTESIEASARAAAKSGVLTEKEASAEAAILRHFDKVLAPLLERGDAAVAAFINRLQAEEAALRPLVARLRRFAEVQQTVAVTVYLVTNPEEGSGGGGAYGGKLVIEVQQKPDPLPALIHEALHFLVDRHRTAVAAAAKSVGLTWQQLNEGIAYAAAPGLTDSGASSDALAEALAQRVMAGAAASDTFVRFYTLATVIRPLLREALDRGDSITAFLPRAVARWRSVANTQAPRK